ncbi:ABC transporter ATP-binding protein/permease [Vagococcus sp.]|uniref:ABC transporter ATP-binding protein/permease n=1 Tax=Vagococcus sp. TaxID=1933889 RepID=UPI003F98DD91
MLELKEIKKYYTVGETTTKALDGVNVIFRKQEFVAVLGPSGSGKTTMLNVVGGLDHYDSGDLIINGRSTQSFKEADWDAYRNNSVGFIFQSYNLIGHLGIIDNVELGMTLSGVPKEVKHEKAREALRRVGLEEHMNKKPNQLSGGQMQRVAIARALANDPEILLCDEPTGALDSETSVQIMELIQELSKEKLVVMVTHNPELANEYADRIIEFSDGRIQTDSNPFEHHAKDTNFELKHTKMKFTTALRLSFNNIRTKKGRTFLTSFASSIGIIGIAVVLSLSNGFQKQIDDTQAETLAKFPITIAKVTSSEQAEDSLKPKKGDAKFPKSKEVIVRKNEFDQTQKINPINQGYVDYVNDINPDLSNNIGYTRMVNMNLFRKVGDKVQPVKFSIQSEDNQEAGAMMQTMTSMTGVGVSSFPRELVKGKGNFLKDNYKLLEGTYPEKETDIVLIIDGDNNANLNALKNLGFDVADGDKLPFTDLVGTTIKLAYNDAVYQKFPTGNFIPNQNLDAIFENKANDELTISGILRVKSSSKMDLLSPGIAYSDALAQRVIAKNKESEIIKAQLIADKNVITNEVLDEQTKANVIDYLGGNELPFSLLIYPNNFKDKEAVLTYLDDYNQGKNKEDKILYSDLAGTMTELTGGLMDAITYVLIAFAAISLVMSMIMISIITYTSVIERTKEIGVLKALGARKKDITRVFDAETTILGITSGVLGVLIAWVVTFPINHVIYNLTELKNVAVLNPIHALVLVGVSTVLTVLGGHIPARMAAKKDASTALRAD